MRVSRITLRLLLLFGLFAGMGLSSPGRAIAQPASEPVYNLDFVNMYTELHPDKNQAEIIATTFFECNGSDPVVFRIEGSIQQMKVTSDPPNIWWVRQPPYYIFPRLEAGVHEVTFSYLVSRPGNEANGAVIAPTKLDLGIPTFWYPRNTASDAHQVLLNLVTPPDYPIVSNGRLTRDVPNNFKRLRTIILEKADAKGLTLSGQ